MKEKPKLLENRIIELKQVVKSAGDFTPKRLKIIFSNTEHRLKEISGLNIKYISELSEVTKECISIMDTTGVKDSFDVYSVKLENLLDTILSESELVGTKV